MQPCLLATLLLLPLLAVTSASDAAGEAYLTANKAKPGVVALPSGLQYEVLRKGKGFKKVEVRVLITRGCMLTELHSLAHPAPPPSLLAHTFHPVGRGPSDAVCAVHVHCCVPFTVQCILLLCHYM